MKKRWKFSQEDRELREKLGRELDILPTTAQLLINRGLVERDRAFSFLSPDMGSLHNPMLFKGMDSAVERIIAALKTKEKICIYGDYDVDGVTSSAVLYLFLKEAGAEPISYIPERRKEGYALNADAISRLHSENVKVIITVDCGISNFDEVKKASSLGIDCIITDHHEVPDTIPPAYSILNPKQKDCPFPFKFLSGVGVAFNLVIQLRSRLRELNWFKGNGPNLKKYLDIVSIGTVADMVPLVDENRILVSFGLKELSDTKRPGLIALKEVSGIKGACSAEDIAFKIAPRINASGRIERADTALKLLITDDTEEAAMLARKLDAENSKRQDIEKKILKEALDMISGVTTDKAIVLSSDGWHPGVIGIVAGRLVERFSVPVIMIAEEGAVGKGSIRSIKGVNILDGLKEVSGLLERFGGHKQAAGFTLKRDKVEEFKRAYVEYMNSTLTEECLIPEVNVDCEVSFEELTGRLVGEIERLSPFGISNTRPLLITKWVEIVATEIIKKKHLRMLVKHNGSMQNAIFFGMGMLHPVKGGFDIAFYPYIDEWQGVRNIRLNVKEIRETNGRVSS